MLAALEKKGILSVDELNAELPDEEQAKNYTKSLQDEFLSLMKELESRTINQEPYINE